MSELDIKKMHEEVFQLLWNFHLKDPNNFFFITRKINRDKKLDKGYWFLGNDDYLAISFWTGTDSLTRTPRIFFKIKSNGETSIEFRNKDVQSHNDYFLPHFIRHIGATSTENGYFKPLKLNNYKDSLLSFLLNEKIIIDEYVHEKMSIDYSTIEWVDPVEFINPKSFEKQIEIIDRYRNVSVHKYDAVDFFKGFTISNFGPLKNISLEIPFDSKWVFLTGENGSGKTSILKAIATGLCQNNDLGERIAYKKRYGDFTINILLSDVFNKTKEFITESNKNYKNKNTLVDGFAAYGPIRLITEGNIDSKILRNEEKIHKKSTYGLFNPIGILMDLSSGYILNAKPKYHDLTKDSIIGNLEYILPNIVSVGENKNGDLLFYEYYENEDFINKGLTFDQLPSGTRNFAGLILDLLIRLQNQQPEIGDISDYVGVVLIDEIDIHLHPKLQIELVKQLSGTFPNIQFIVSTHSPITLLGAPEKSIFIKVEKSQKNGISIERLRKLEKEIKYLTPNTILSSDIFDFDFMENIPVETFDKIYLEDDYEEIGKNQELNQRLKNLDKSIFPDDLFKDEDQNGI